VEMKLKRKLAVGAAVVAAAAFGGGAYAATQNSGSNSRQAFLNDLAKRLNVTPGQLNSALLGAFGDQLQAAVKAGRLTQAQADQIRQRAQQSGHVPFGGPGAGHFWGGPDGRGPDGPGGPTGPGGPGGPGGQRFGAVSAAATYLGLTPAQIRDQLVAGKSLAQIAGAQHKSVSGLKDAITKAERTGLDKALTAKMLTSAQEQQILSRLSARLDTLINRKGLGPRFGAGRGFLGHRGRMGAGAGFAPPGAPPQNAAPSGNPPAGALPQGPPPPAY
jgi:hypothetical protein